MKQSILKIEKEIVKLLTRKHKIQLNCKHINKNLKHGANTGNYDPSNDCYWTDFDCLDCGKRWREEGSK